MSRERPRFYDLHGAPDAIARREALAPDELRRLGLPEALREGPTLDVCCGFGEVLRALSAHGVGSLVGVEIHDRPIDAPAVRARAEALPFADASMANVLCLHSLHHLDSAAAVEAFLDEARRVLRPGGCLALLDQRDSWLFRIALGVAKRVGPAMLREQLREEYREPPHYFTDWRAVERVLEQRGFAVEMRSAGLLSVALRLSV